MIAILIIVAVILLAIHIALFAMWCYDLWDNSLSYYFSSKDTAIVFFIPIIGMFALIIAMARKKFNSEFN